MGFSRTCGLFILSAVPCKYTNMVYYFVDDVHESIPSRAPTTALDATALLYATSSAWTAWMWCLMGKYWSAWRVTAMLSFGMSGLQSPHGG